MYERRTTSRPGAPGETPSRPKQRCRPYALWLLGRREWGEKELRARLVLKGFMPEEIDDCVAFCQKHGLQSDERYASSRVRSRGSRTGDRKLKSELRNQGISEEAAQPALDGLAPEIERALASVRRFEGLPADMKLKAKVWRFLASRGFSGSAVQHAWRALRDAAVSKGADDDSDVEPDYD